MKGVFISFGIGVLVLITTLFGCSMGSGEATCNTGGLESSIGCATGMFLVICFWIVFLFFMIIITNKFVKRDK